MTALDARRRAADLSALADPDRRLDVLVVGGGITGVGVALDAATRGLRVALVEAHDLAFGTSRWSSKLVHGGLRYLASGQFGIAYESAVERHHLLTTIAPHLIHPLLQVIPDFGSRRTATLVRAGLIAGDLLRRAARTPESVLPGPHRISADEAVRLCPTVSRDQLRGAMIGADGQLVDDARLVVAVARTAAAFGASICTYTRADEVTGTGARLTDTRTGQSFTGSARTVVNATGVWAGTVQESLRVRPSRGTHLVFDAAAFGYPTAALTVPLDTSGGRFVFALPGQLGRIYVGITDVDAPGPIPDVPSATDDEIDFLLDAINVATDRPVSRTDIRGTYSGLRPLVDAGTQEDDSAAADLADVSRRHQVRVDQGTLVSVIGGKLTTYRRMAQDATDAAVRAGKLTAGPCVTTSIPLVGAADTGPQRGIPQSMVHRYGAEATKVAGIARVREPLAPIAGSLDVTRAEVEFAVTNEGALTADDVLDRRTRLGLVESDAALARAAVEEIVASTLRQISP